MAENEPRLSFRGMILRREGFWRRGTYCEVAWKAMRDLNHTERQVGLVLVLKDVNFLFVCSKRGRGRVGRFGDMMAVENSIFTELFSLFCTLKYSSLILL